MEYRLVQITLLLPPPPYDLLTNVASICLTYPTTRISSILQIWELGLT